MEHFCTINYCRQQKDGTKDEVLSARIVNDSVVCKENGYGKLSLPLFDLPMSVQCSCITTKINQEQQLNLKQI